MHTVCLHKSVVGQVLETSLNVLFSPWLLVCVQEAEETAPEEEVRLGLKARGGAEQNHAAA